MIGSERPLSVREQAAQAQAEAAIDDAAWALVNDALRKAGKRDRVINRDRDSIQLGIQAGAAAALAYLTRKATP